MGKLSTICPCLKNKEKKEEEEEEKEGKVFNKSLSIKLFCHIV